MPTDPKSIFSADATKEDIRNLYRMMLGREIDEASLDAEFDKETTVGDLVRRIAGTREFNLHFGAAVSAYRQRQIVERPFSRIDCRVEPSQLAALFKHVKEVWTRLGEIEPHYSVLSQSRFKPSEINERMEEYNITGRLEVDHLKSEISALGIDMTEFQTGLELGCGTGRVSRFLSPCFNRFYGCDISVNHLRAARSYLDKSGIVNAQFFEIKNPDDLVFPEYDFFYSRIVFQHNPPPIIAFTLKRVLERLTAGGVAVFQVVTHIRRYTFLIENYLKVMEGLSNQEIHVIPQREVFDIIADAGCRPIFVYRDASLNGDDYHSDHFVVRKDR